MFERREGVFGQLSNAVVAADVACGQVLIVNVRLGPSVARVEVLAGTETDLS